MRPSRLGKVLREEACVWGAWLRSEEGVSVDHDVRLRPLRKQPWSCQHLELNPSWVP